MRYANIYDFDVVNGNKIWVSIFFQGCSHHCKSCFNKETWDFDGGKELTQKVRDKILEVVKKPYVDYVSFLGGEPLDQPLKELYDFISDVKLATQKPIYLWTGYTYEDIMKDSNKYLIIRDCVDYLIDGKFDESQKDLTLWLRGSKNQRVIDVKKSLDNNKIITLEVE